jgi:hypothetical protein
MALAESVGVFWKVFELGLVATIILLLYTAIAILDNIDESI